MAGASGPSSRDHAPGGRRVYDLGPTNKVIIDLDRGYLLVSAISPGSALGVLAGKDANLGDGHDEQQVSGVRPYFITGGRARPVDSTMHIETQVLTTWDGRTSMDRLTYEHRDIVALCMRPVSVAEIAAHLRLHLGVARVIVADLVALGYLVVRQADLGGARQEAHIIERVIRGLTAIR